MRGAHEEIKDCSIQFTGNLTTLANAPSLTPINLPFSACPLHARFDKMPKGNLGQFESISVHLDHFNRKWRAEGTLLRSQYKMVRCDLLN